MCPYESLYPPRLPEEWLIQGRYCLLAFQKLCPISWHILSYLQITEQTAASIWSQLASWQNNVPRRRSANSENRFIQFELEFSVRFEPYSLIAWGRFGHQRRKGSTVGVRLVHHHKSSINTISETDDSGERSVGMQWYAHTFVFSDFFWISLTGITYEAGTSTSSSWFILIHAIDNLTTIYLSVLRQSYNSGQMFPNQHTFALTPPYPSTALYRSRNSTLLIFTKWRIPISNFFWREFWPFIWNQSSRISFITQANALPLTLTLGHSVRVFNCLKISILQSRAISWKSLNWEAITISRPSLRIYATWFVHAFMNQ
jgi:hypothetical protein